MTFIGPVRPMSISATIEILHHQSHKLTADTDDNDHETWSLHVV